MTSPSAQVLVVDDDHDLAAAISAELARDSLECVVADDGRSAVRALRERPFDALVTDMRMNGMDGLELMVEAKRARPDLPVVVVTGFASISAAVEAMKRGAYHYLAKPIDGAELRNVVRAAVTSVTRGRADGDGQWTLDEVIRRHVSSVLLQTGGDKVAAAKILGVHVSTLYRWQHGWRRREGVNSEI